MPAPEYRRPRPARRTYRALLLLLATLPLAGACRKEATAPPALDKPPFSTSWETGDPALDAMPLRLRPLLDANRKVFAGRTGAVRGFGAGEAYPQIWLRDSATLLPLSRFEEPRAGLTSWLVEHLAHQEPSGALFDWIAPGEPASFPYAPRAREVFRQGALVMSADKNTAAADQESSAVLAAALAFAATSDVAWLRAEVGDRSLLERLDGSLSYVARERKDQGTGLIVTALTADWGDVSPAHEDQRAIYLDASTPRVGSLYATALYHGAVQALAGLHRAAGEEAKAARWTGEAAAVKSAVRRHLWRARDGFFQMHAHLRSTGPHPDDLGMFALGGNAMAILYGLADEAETRLIRAAAETRHQQHGLTTLAGTLLPSYPSGFFKHPILSEAWTYQNGGLWDWFAGRFLTALFERGQSEAATRHLLAIAHRMESSAGFYEWTDREGRGRGSPAYAGSGAALAQAVLQGLLGIRAEADGLHLSVRLGSRPGRVSVTEPASGRALSYEYRARLEASRLELRLSTKPAPRFVEVLLPAGVEPAAVSLDGAPVAFSLREAGDDRYVTLVEPRGGELIVSLTGFGQAPGRSE